MRSQCSWTCPNCGGQCGGYSGHPRSHQCPNCYRPTKTCAHCGDETEDYYIIEKGPPGQNWLADAWVKLGYEGKPVCMECYYK